MYMVNAAAPSVNLNNSDLICNATTKVSYYSADTCLVISKAWFLLCGLQAYIYRPKNAAGGLRTLGRLTVSLLKRNTSTKYKQEAAEGAYLRPHQQIVTQTQSC